VQTSASLLVSVVLIISYVALDEMQFANKIQNLPPTDNNIV